MRRFVPRATTFVAALGLAAGALLTGSGSASAVAYGCPGWYCTGQDPQASGCSADAQTIYTSSTGVELRYSPTCRSAWARSYGNAGDNITVQSRAGDSETYYFNGSGTAWTPMVDDAGTESFACQYFHGGGSSCTGAY